MGSHVLSIQLSAEVCLVLIMRGVDPRDARWIIVSFELLPLALYRMNGIR